MLQMLVRDQEIFERRFTDAFNFMIAARLRLEVYGMASHYTSADKTDEIGSARYDRLIELLTNAPACREPWFVVQLRGDFPQIEDVLVKVGL